MQIGDRLKQSRLCLGLDQREMAANVLDQSYYSRVESNQNKIRVQTLLALLELHQVPLMEFLNDFGDTQPKNRPYQEKIEDAFFKKDNQTLKQIIADPAFSNQKIKQIAKLLLSKMGEPGYSLSDSKKRNLKYNIFKLGKWDLDSLWIFSMSMNLYSFEELTGLVNSIFNKCVCHENDDNYFVTLLANIATRYARVCYQKKQLKELEIAVNYLNHLPASKIIMLQKLTALYFQNKLKHNSGEAKKIKYLLELSGYEINFE